MDIEVYNNKYISILENNGIVRINNKFAGSYIFL